MIPVPYHGIHAAAAQPDAVMVRWLKPQRRCARVRVKEHTCECKVRIYELCQAGGLFFVRRTDRGRSGQQVMETEWLPSVRAQELWHNIITGRAV
ncbi:hypothetical protein [Sphaerimonospora thailandensis]|uniref:Uncharacterized protein n=1 Tax=Sphaerimonospora thailandensis TaxID=795644 RepID=A0A8J3W1T5_9ACTN|nr:hypothetical protein [Sphaerimonospora thailandensis]GIH73112.1 hypothetical protein Mth01_53650 [Sphaerimonospora thailandensis]